MTDITALKELLERVEKAEGADREIDWRIGEAFDVPERWRIFPGMWPPFMEGSKFDKAIPRYTSSIDACVALIEKVLPEYRWRVDRDGWASLLAYDSENFHYDHIEMGKTPPLALLAVLLSALIAKEELHE